MSHAIIPGSFDPMTMGHLWLVEQVAAEFDRVTVAVMINESKQYCFDMQTRVAIAKKTVEALPNVQVISDRGMLIDLYDRLEADAVCKGWRNEVDLAYEQEMAAWNQEHNPRFCTKLYRSEGEYCSLSSTEVRGLLGDADLLKKTVHPNALPLILSALSAREDE